MNVFIERYFSRYLEYCRTQGCHPVSGSELEQIITYLQEQNASPILVGPLAIFQYIDFTDQDIHMRSYRPISFVDLLVSVHVSHPPINWQESSAQTAHTLWTSPSGGLVRLLTPTHLLKGDEPKDFSLTYNHLSVEAGCPAIDIMTLFLLKLSSTSPHDISDLLRMAIHVKIPKNLEKKLWNSTQEHNLKMIQKWLQFHHPRAF